MQRHSPTSVEDSRDECHCNRCGGRSAGDSSREFAFSTSLTGGADDSGETWFRNENSTAERKSLSRLEKELEAALRFEYGDGEEGGLRVHPMDHSYSRGPTLPGETGVGESYKSLSVFPAQGIHEVPSEDERSRGPS